jgi:hypothetical protein
VSEPEQPEQPEQPERRLEVRLRRAPRYRAFVLTGVGLGVLAGTVLALLFPADGRYSGRAIVGYLALTLALVCGLLGATVAVLVERRRR